MSLRSFCDAHLQIDAIAHHVHFHGVELIEQITIVPIGITHGVLVLGEALVQMLLVVDITLLHVEDVAQAHYVAYTIGRINRVAHPCDVADVVLPAFVDFHIDVDMLRIGIPHAVLKDNGIAITVFIVFLDELLLVFLPTLGGELLRLEERRQLTSLMGLCKGTLREQTALDLLVGQVVVAFDVDVAHLHLLLLVDHHVEDDAIPLRHVLALQDFDVGILEALVVEILLGKNLRTVDDVRMNAHALCHTELLLHVLTLRLLQADIVDFRHTRTSCQRDVKPDAVANDGVGGNRHVREQSVTPIALHSVGDLCARHLDLLTDGQTRDSRKGIVLVAIHARDVDASQHECAWCAGIGDVRKLYDVLCKRIQSNKKGYKQRDPSPTLSHAEGREQSCWYVFTTCFHIFFFRLFL